ncbi:MAG: sporulation transcriptional regulator SpoIIID [Blautia sp.]|nr:sporulation transcriptional regulator SpoIIID [Blautia sp.]
MKDYIEERAIDIAHYIISEKATVRQTAKKFGVSKSTVHKDAGVIIGRNYGIYRRIIWNLSQQSGCQWKTEGFLEYAADGRSAGRFVHILA